MNEDLQKLHDLLIAQHQALFQQLDVADAATAKTIITEMQEILHRIDVLQGLLFRKTTTALAIPPRYGTIGDVKPGLSNPVVRVGKP